MRDMVVLPMRSRWQSYSTSPAFTVSKLTAIAHPFRRHAALVLGVAQPAHPVTVPGYSHDAASPPQALASQPLIVSHGLGLGLRIVVGEATAGHDLGDGVGGERWHQRGSVRLPRRRSRQSKTSSP